MTSNSMKHAEITWQMSDEQRTKSNGKINESCRKIPGEKI